MLFTFPSRYLFAIGLSVVFSLTRWSWLVQAGFLVPRRTQGTAGIYNPYVYGTFTLYRWPFQNHSTSNYIFVSQPYNPVIAETTTVWANPLSLATTRGITFVLFSSGYLDVSVHRVCLPPIARGNFRLRGRVAPFGYLRINSYLPIPAVFRSLSRPSSPLRAKASSVRP